MKKKILILVKAGTGKTTLANILAKETGFKVVEECRYIEWFMFHSEEYTIYTSNCVEMEAAKAILTDFTIIELS